MTHFSEDLPSQLCSAEEATGDLSTPEIKVCELKLEMLASAQQIYIVALYLATWALIVS